MFSFRSFKAWTSLKKTLQCRCILWLLMDIWEHVLQSTCLSFVFDLFWLQKQPFAVFFAINVLKNFAIFTGKHVCWSLFNKAFNKSFLIKSTGAFLWILRNAFFVEHRWWPLLWLLNEELQDRITEIQQVYINTDQSNQANSIWYLREIRLPMQRNPSSYAAITWSRSSHRWWFVKEGNVRKHLWNLRNI